MKPAQSFADLPALATHLRSELENKKTILLYAYNGTGKTWLSMAFKDMGKQDDARDTLYFNAFTEDLFHWNNDLAGDADRRLLLNKDSRFFQGSGNGQPHPPIAAALRGFRLPDRHRGPRVGGALFAPGGWSAR